MNAASLFPFVGSALVFAFAGTILFALIMREAGKKQWRPAIPAAFMTLFFLGLTQQPFPDITTMRCPIPTAEPQLRLFQFTDAWLKLAHQNLPPMDWLRNRLFVASAMNYFLLAAVGFCLGPLPLRFKQVALFAVGLTLVVELTQLTGFWGIFPCAYRQFNIDDLMLNSLGVMSGFLLGRALLRPRRRRRRSRRA